MLFVDDEDSFHFAMGEYLGQLGYLLDSAHDAREACERLASSSYPVVITDLRLSLEPGHAHELEGLEIVDRVHRDHPGTGVVVLTACGSELEAEALRRGAHCFLQKPQPLAHIARVVEALCAGRAPPGAGEATFREGPGAPGPRGDQA